MSLEAMIWNNLHVVLQAELLEDNGDWRGLDLGYETVSKGPV